MRVFGRRPGLDLVDTDAMSAFFAALDHLDEGELARLRASWRGIGRQAHEQAWADVRAVGAREGLTGEIDRVRDRAVAWARRGSNRPAPFLADDRTWLEMKIEASEAIVDAALAIALGDRLEAQTHRTLLAPWESVGAVPENRA